MKGYLPENIKNISILGHLGCGKTSLVEASLFASGATKKLGKVVDGTTVSDYLKEEKQHQMSISTAVIPVEYKEHKINFLDTPGALDFIGEVSGALRVTRSAVIVIDASSGVEVGTENAWDHVRRHSMPTIIFVNKMDKDNVNFDNILTEIREKLGKRVVPFCIPIGRNQNFEGFVNVVDMKARIYDGTKCVDAEIWEEKLPKVEELHGMIVESVAETSEELMEKFFAGEEFTIDEIKHGLFEGINKGELVPLIVGSAEKSIGVHTLLDMILSYFPKPTDMRLPFGEALDKFEIIERKMDIKEPFSAIVFKTVIDPFVGKISYLKVRSGSIHKDQLIYIPNKDVKTKMNNLYYIRGKEQLEAETVNAGDICIVTKMVDLETGDTLCDVNNPIKYREMKTPMATLYYSIEPKNQKDEDKISEALNRIAIEDLTIDIIRNAETKQQLLGGQGKLHIDMIVEKLKNIYNVEVTLGDTRISYRETIKGTSDVQGKYKKQTGGAGQYGDVKIKFEHCDEDFIFAEEVFGGSVPKNYIPAVEKGLLDCIKSGVLAGYPVIGLKAILYDGSYHPVDSSELAFKMAASLAFKEGCKKAKPTLLEPIMSVKIKVPNDYVGDIMGDLNKRRGIVNGIEIEENHQIILADVPQVEMLTYTIDLKAMTQARGVFEMEFKCYDECPVYLADKVIAEAKISQE